MLQELDEGNGQMYAQNAKAYIEKLDGLDARYEETLRLARLNTLLFADRFPFRYLTDDYNLRYFAAFPGCYAETEASFETIVFLSEKTDELSLHSIIILEGTNPSIARTVIQNTKEKNQEILTLDSIQSVTAKEVKEGKTYLSVMEKNLQTLKSALS